jgi:hypothetical protein
MLELRSSLLIILLNLRRMHLCLNPASYRLDTTAIFEIFQTLNPDYTTRQCFEPERAGVFSLSARSMADWPSSRQSANEISSHTRYEARALPLFILTNQNGYVSRIAYRVSRIACMRISRGRSAVITYTPLVRHVISRHDKFMPLRGKRDDANHYSLAAHERASDAL